MPRIVITEPDSSAQPYRFELERNLVDFGRGSDNDIILTCRSTSGVHCTMERVDGGFILRDQDSTNGISLDKKRMDIIDLKDGMTIFMGDVTMDFELSKDEINILSKESFEPHQKELQSTSEQASAKEDAEIVPLKENTSAPDKDSEPEQRSKADNGSSPAPASPVGYSPQMVQSSGSPLKPLLLFILIIAAVFTGMTVSHKLRTGVYLPNKVIELLDRSPGAEKTNESEGSEDSSENEQ